MHQAAIRPLTDSELIPNGSNVPPTKRRPVIPECLSTLWSFQGASLLYTRLPQELLDMTAFDILWELHPTEYKTCLIRGRTCTMHRWQQAYGLSYWFSGVNHEAIPTPDHVLPYLQWANNLGLGTFNQILLNWYNDGTHSIGAHSDDERAILFRSPIVTITLGGSRPFVISPKRNTRIGIADQNLFQLNVRPDHGDVFIMAGTFQQLFTHAVPPTSYHVDRRISITLRQMKI